MNGDCNLGSYQRVTEPCEALLSQSFGVRHKVRTGFSRLIEGENSD